MSFTAEQCRALTAKLDGRAIRERIQAGQTLSYVEGWYVIAEANRVFGFDGWDRETVSVRCVWEGPRQGRPVCAYMAQVRIRVRAGETLICRDGHGSGMGTGSTPGEAHETAVKEAETDATKRALVTFGNAFGLCLYDREQKQVRRRRKPQPPVPSTEWPLRSATGEVIKSYADPAQFCSALRKALEGCTAAKDLTALWTQHDGVLAALQQLSQLKSERGEHYARDPSRALSQTPARAGASRHATPQRNAACPSGRGGSATRRICAGSRSSRASSAAGCRRMPIT